MPGIIKLEQSKIFELENDYADMKSWLFFILGFEEHLFLIRVNSPSAIFLWGAEMGPCLFSETAINWLHHIIIALALKYCGHPHTMF